MLKNKSAQTGCEQNQEVADLFTGQVNAIPQHFYFSFKVPRNS